MRTLLAKDRFLWTPRLSGRPLGQLRHRVRWEGAHIQGPASVHVPRTPWRLPPRRRAQLAPADALAHHLAIAVYRDILLDGCCGRQIAHNNGSSTSPWVTLRF